MKTAEFLNTLRAHADRPLVFQRGGRTIAAPGYHLTEVKRTTIESMDCGAVTHRWVENHFEIWSPPGVKEAGRADFMPAGKCLRITDLVERQVALDRDADAKIYAGDREHGAVLYSIDRLELADGHLVVRLEADATRCKARERQLAGAPASTPACCGDGESAGDGESGCGCAAPRREAAACCA